MIQAKCTQPKWWWLYILALLVVGVLFLIHYLTPSSGWRTFLEIGVVIGGYGLISWWLETHSISLLDRSAIDASIAQLAQEEEFTLPLPQVRCQFYVAGDPAIIYGEPERAMFQ
ncbi:MAG: hypothetical protein U0401_18460 [Anaerolineae bacterium]